MEQQSSGSQESQIQESNSGLSKADMLEIISAIKGSNNGGIDTAELLKAVRGEDKDLRHQAHNLTQGKMKTIKKDQSASTVKKVKGNKVKRYEFPEYEKDFIHLSIEKPTYKDGTDIKTSRPKTVILSMPEFIRMSESVKAPGAKSNPENAFSGYKVVVLHDPRLGTAEEVKEGEENKPLTPAELLADMTDGQIRKVYEAMFYEEAMLSDSKQDMIDLILQQMKVSGKEELPA